MKLKKELPSILLYCFSQHNYVNTFSPAGLYFVFLLPSSFINRCAGDQIKCYFFLDKGEISCFLEGLGKRTRPAHLEGDL